MTGFERSAGVTGVLLLVGLWGCSSDAKPLLSDQYGDRDYPSVLVMELNPPFRVIRQLNLKLDGRDLSVGAGWPDDESAAVGDADVSTCPIDQVLPDQEPIGCQSAPREQEQLDEARNDAAMNSGELERGRELFTIARWSGYRDDAGRPSEAMTGRHWQMSLHWPGAEETEWLYVRSDTQDGPTRELLEYLDELFVKYWDGDLSLPYEYLDADAGSEGS